MRPESHFCLLLDDSMIESEGQLRWPQAHPRGLLTIWVLSPLGARVELLAPSANARVCVGVGAGSDRPVSYGTVRRARSELAAEYLAKTSQWGRMLQLLGRRPETRRHIVAINPGTVLPALKVARHHVRVIEGRLACKHAVHSMLGDDMSSVDNRK